MRFPFLAASILVSLLPACSPVEPAPPRAKVTADAANEALRQRARNSERETEILRQELISKPNPPDRVYLSASFTRSEITGITFEGVAFDSNAYRLAVVDQPGGPGSRFPDAAAAGTSRNGVAATNAGFFTPEGAPLGKVISAGTAAGSWNRSSSLGSGVFYESASGTMALARREAVSPGGQRELLQAGPMLLENGRPISGLDPQKPAARIFLLWDGGSRWWLGRASSCTLAQLTAALGQGSPAGWKAKQALNLDGGRSADLWVSGKVSGGPFSSRPPWNRPVRNFLVLIAR